VSRDIEEKKLKSKEKVIIGEIPAMG
jgi:hypothetical protein